MNFALILFVLVVVTGIAWVADKCIFSKRRRAHAKQALADFDRDGADLKNRYTAEEIARARSQVEAKKLSQPWWLESTASLFPVILTVFLLRSFIVEPFKIPSGSMVPTLVKGDFILVNKFTYGIRLPVINKKIIDVNQPQRGEVMVFRYPKDTSLDFIERVVGTPGDIVRYENKRLSINGKPLEYQPLPDYLDEERLTYAQQYAEKLGKEPHRLLNDADRLTPTTGLEPFPLGEYCSHTMQSLECKVPPGHYFMMGDNRDNSSDSRVWGFVPEENIVGRAFFIWMNLSDIKRIGFFK